MYSFSCYFTVDLSLVLHVKANYCQLHKYIDILQFTILKRALVTHEQLDKMLFIKIN